MLQVIYRGLIGLALTFGVLSRHKRDGALAGSVLWPYEVPTEAAGGALFERVWNFLSRVFSRSHLSTSTFHRPSLNAHRFGLRTSWPSYRKRPGHIGGGRAKGRERSTPVMMRTKSNLSGSLPGRFT